jgi:hypothetical protein
MLFLLDTNAFEGTQYPLVSGKDVGKDKPRGRGNFKRRPNMAGFREYDHYDALGLAELVRNKQISPRELLEEAIARVERVNPTVNAVVTTMYDQARTAIAAGLPQGPFTGVPR